MIKKKHLQVFISPTIALLAILVLIFGTITLKVKEEYSRKLSKCFYASYYIDNIENYFQILMNLHQAEIYYVLSKKNPKLKEKAVSILEKTLNITSSPEIKLLLENLLEKVKENKAKTFDFSYVIGQVEKNLFGDMKTEESFLFLLKFKDLQNKEENLYWHLQDFSKSFALDNQTLSSDYLTHLIKLIELYYPANVFQKCHIQLNKDIFSSVNLVEYLISCIFKDLQSQFNLFVYSTKKKIEEKEKYLKKRESIYEKLSIISILIALILLLYSFILFFKEKQKLEEALIKDDLTDTFNKEAFYEIIKDKTGYLIILDLVKFKRFNEIYGRKYGDYILKLISKRILETFKEYNPVVSRFWSNTFVIFLPTHDDKFKNYSFLKNIKDKLEKPIILEQGLEYVPKFTMIVKEKLDCSRCLKSECDFFSFVEYLEDFAKHESKGSILIYEGNVDFRGKLKEIVQKEKLLHKAIKENSIIAYFQPIVNSSDFTPYAFECLARIKNGDKVLPAGMFIDIAIETGLILDIDLQMLRYISKVRKELPVKLFINLSPKSLYSKYIIEELRNIYLGNSVFEITEQFVVENIEQLEKLRKELNLDFAIDDFGTGFSSLHTVLDLSSRGIIKYLKIDGSLIKDLVNNKRKQEIIETIVIMAKKLHLKTIAEFVEDEETAKLLNKLGVDYLQGFYFAPPMSLEDVKNYLKKFEKKDDVQKNNNSSRGEGENMN